MQSALGVQPLSVLGPRPSPGCPRRLRPPDHGEPAHELGGAGPGGTTRSRWTRSATCRPSGPKRRRAGRARRRVAGGSAAATAAAGRCRPALLRGPQRGRDGRGARLLDRHREVADQPCGGHLAGRHDRGEAGDMTDQLPDLGALLTRTLHEHAVGAPDPAGLADRARREPAGSVVAGPQRRWRCWPWSLSASCFPRRSVAGGRPRRRPIGSRTSTWSHRPEPAPLSRWTTCRSGGLRAGSGWTAGPSTAPTAGSCRFRLVRHGGGRVRGRGDRLPTGPAPDARTCSGPTGDVRSIDDRKPTGRPAGTARSRTSTLEAGVGSRCSGRVSPASSWSVALPNADATHIAIGFLQDGRVVVDGGCEHRPRPFDVRS